MISELTGKIVHKDDDACVVDVHGIGFRVDMSKRALAALPDVQNPVHLYTHLVVREDNWRLIGFLEVEERETFLDLIAVGGMGIKTALSVLGVLGVDGLEEAISQEQWQTIKDAPGVGAKLAQRILLELSGKWQNKPRRHSPNAGPSLPRSVKLDDVGEALMALGYSLEEAQAASRQTAAEGDLADRIREALRTLDRR
ncbi:MAG: Holliday junction branch migration protein RuvA [Sulfobacillus thermosulfidooxidans]|uniref:Holliday junction branch migration complex subunit RuvA n=1 Tax=Sulfobacillus thermotolerans TaxID=338644 RepID=A0ABM6RS75_9FIRM|nr:Holliday junction branch migration protein RuvA [Sulfobacillus sp. hq2]AUW94264.1 Holliday junction branch migration protein RuvA [Sulfobacillus thermotolerans]MCY0907826.1 Holliday junction branch migration protein RuvA [Sulfobacillus thermotolerans]POB09458.1 Holliday junction branch migration protein RuvA [Sulfobacillus sp. hq2]PSR37405.1 MAG: Holliday junction branch migration protein RuvA [Sulfobacillus thermosulfidooxidans]